MGRPHPQTLLHVVGQIWVVNSGLAALEAKAAKVAVVQQIGHRSEVRILAEIIEISRLAPTSATISWPSLVRAMPSGIFSSLATSAFLPLPSILETVPAKASVT